MNMFYKKDTLRYEGDGIFIFPYGEKELVYDMNLNNSLLKQNLEKRIKEIEKEENDSFDQKMKKNSATFHANFSVQDNFIPSSLKVATLDNTRILYLGADNDFDYYFNFKNKEIDVCRGNIDTNMKMTSDDWYSFLLVGQYRLFSKTSLIILDKIINENINKINLSESQILSLVNFSKNNKENISEEVIQPEPVKETKQILKDKLIKKTVSFKIENGIAIFEEGIVKLIEIKSVYREKNKIVILQDKEEKMKVSINNREFAILKEKVLENMKNVF